MKLFSFLNEFWSEMKGCIFSFLFLFVAPFVLFATCAYSDRIHTLLGTENYPDSISKYKEMSDSLRERLEYTQKLNRYSCNYIGDTILVYDTDGTIHLETTQADILLHDRHVKKPFPYDSITTVSKFVRAKHFCSLCINHELYHILKSKESIQIKK